MPPLCLRSESAPRTIGSTDLERTYNGPGTDLQRTWNGPAMELHRRDEKVLAESRRSLYLVLGMALECFSHFYIAFQAY